MPVGSPDIISQSRKADFMPRFIPHLLGVLLANFFLIACGPTTAPAPKLDSGTPDKPKIDKPKTGELKTDQPKTDLPKDQTRPVEKPVPPLQLAMPSAMPEQVDGKDLKKMDEAELFGPRNQAMTKEDYSHAATYQYWFVQKTKTGQYNLACFLAQIGQTDAAFYWLQQAAIEEGVDSTHAQRDSDLTSLRRDPRWAKLRNTWRTATVTSSPPRSARLYWCCPKTIRKARQSPRFYGCTDSVRAGRFRQQRLPRVRRRTERRVCRCERYEGAGPAQLCVGRRTRKGRQAAARSPWRKSVTESRSKRAALSRSAFRKAPKLAWMSRCVTRRNMLVPSCCPPALNRIWTT